MGVAEEVSTAEMAAKVVRVVRVATPTNATLRLAADTEAQGATEGTEVMAGPAETEATEVMEEMSQSDLRRERACCQLR